MKNEKIIEELYDQMMAELNSEYKELSSSTANQQDYFGAYVVPITSSMFETIPIWKRIGRLIQVRKKAGSFCSDIFTLRLIDASITPWENESFWIVPEEYKARLDEVFEASIFCDNWDNPIENSIGIVGIDYCDNPDKRYIGFIIPAELTDKHL